MADQKISELTSIGESGVSIDYLPIIDKSASQTKSIKISSLMYSGVTEAIRITSAVSRDVLPIVDVSGVTMRKITTSNLFFGSLFRKGSYLMPANKAGATVTFVTAFPDTQYTPHVSLLGPSGATYATRRIVMARNPIATGMWVSVTPPSAAKDVTVCYFCVYDG